jgi:uncharacterized membrane protein YqgA involved in biofilm formation
VALSGTKSRVTRRRPDMPGLLQHLADAVLVLHLAVVLFVVGGLVVVVAGNLRGWRFANAPAFRWAHLALIVTVVVQSWFGLECPLTTLENWLRAQAGATGYGGGGFIQHWVSAILFYTAPTWVFAVVYTAFGAAVLASWLAWPPRRFRPG